MRLATRVRSVVVVLGTACAGLAACGGGNKDSETAENAKTEDTAAESSSATPEAADAAPAPEPDKKTLACSGMEIDLMAALSQSVCEVDNPKPDAKPRELKGVLETRVQAMPLTVASGGHVDVTVTFVNKGKDPLPLDFTVDPLPRFWVEVYDQKGRRVDLPPGDPPARKSSAPAATPSTARALLVTTGTAKVTVGWDAKRMRWAPEKEKGTPPEQGYPKAPAGPLPKGKYTLRVVTPLVGVFEGSEREVSAPKFEITVN